MMWRISMLFLGNLHEIPDTKTIRAHLARACCQACKLRFGSSSSVQSTSMFAFRRRQVEEIRERGMFQHCSTVYQPLVCSQGRISIYRTTKPGRMKAEDYQNLMPTTVAVPTYQSIDEYETPHVSEKSCDLHQ